MLCMCVVVVVTAAAAAVVDGVLFYVFYVLCLGSCFFQSVCLADWLVLCLYNKIYHFIHHSVAVLRGRRAYFYTPLSVEFIYIFCCLIGVTPTKTLQKKKIQIQKT